MQPKGLIICGFFLVVFGVVMPLLMVVEVINSTFVLNFVAHGASVVGLFLGLYGSSMIVRSHRKRD